MSKATPRTSPYRLVSHEQRVVPALPLCKTIIDVAVARGADKDKILQGTRLFPDDLSADSKVSVFQLVALISNAAKYTHTRDLGFQIGQALATSHYSGFLRAMGYCRNLGQVVALIPHFMLQVCPLVSVSVFRQQQHTWLTVHDAVGRNKHFELVTEMVFAAFIALSKQWVGARLPLSFYFTHSRPRHIAEYEMHLGRRLHFSQFFQGVSISDEAMYRPFLHVDRFLRNASVHHYRKSHAAGHLLPVVIRNMVTRNPHITAAEAAYALNLSPATLKRKLAVCCCTFSGLVDSVKREQAYFLLQIGQLSNEQSALTMAISDLTNFRRAVKRWTGLTPSELRSR